MDNYTSPEWLSRTNLLVGQTGLEKLHHAHVMVVGLGGVGSFAAEFIARSGVGNITIIDGDLIEDSNRNRQLPALATNIGMAKVDVMQDRLLNINPQLQLTSHQLFITPQMVADLFKDTHPHFIIDAIDSITPKITIIQAAKTNQIPIVSSMGAGGKLDPTQIKVADLSKTYNCPFAQQVRKQLKPIGGSKGVHAVFSTEMPNPDSLMLTDGSRYKKSAYGTMSYIPATFGAVAASVAIRLLMGKLV